VGRRGVAVVGPGAVRALVPVTHQTSSAVRGGAPEHQGAVLGGAWSGRRRPWSGCACWGAALTLLLAQLLQLSLELGGLHVVKPGAWGLLVGRRARPGDPAAARVLLVPLGRQRPEPSRLLV